jgi:hypothetical protein
MKYFFDTEFDEDGRTIDLISIGIIAEDGRTFYAESNEFDPEHCNEWVQKNVLNLLGPEWERQSRAEIRDGILKFIGDDTPEFWAYFADYDWVVFCQLFGKMIDLPPGWPMFCMDIKQLAHETWGGGVYALPRQKSVEHNALNDAKWNYQAYDVIKSGLRFSQW